MMPDLNHLLNEPFEKWPLKLLAVSSNSEGRVNSAIIKHRGVKLYVTRCYRPNGSCYFKVDRF